MLSTKAYLYRMYLVLFSVTAMVMILVGVVLLMVQARNAHQVFVDRVTKIVNQHRNEFLNEIALDDMAAIKQHVEILRDELAVDSVKILMDRIEVQSQTQEVLSGATPKAAALSVLLHENWDKLVTPISNEFETVKAEVVVEYHASFLRGILNPLMRLSSSLLLVSLILTGALFVFVFRSIERSLIRPLRSLTRQMEGDELSVETVFQDFQNSRLKEISALAMAAERFSVAQKRSAFADLARQVAHDIRSPLALLKAATSMLAGGSAPPEMAEMLRLSSERINEIASGLLNRSRGGVSSQALADLHCCPIEIASQILSEKNTALIAAGSSVKVDLTFDPNLKSSQVMISGTELSRTLSNLIQNGIEACEGQRSPKVEVALSQEGKDFLRLSVKDNGRGVPPDVIGRLGELNFTFGKVNGNGLGLYQVKSMVKQAGGTFIVESQIGEGTTVSLTLPLVSQTGTKNEPLRSQAASQIAQVGKID